MTIKTRWIIVTVLVVAIATAIAYGCHLYRDIRRDLWCKGGLREFHSIVTTADGGVLSWDAYRQQEAGFVPTSNWCYGTRSPYVYRPFEGRIRWDWRRGGVVGPPAPCRMILWCPRACHRGHRNVLLEDGRVIEMEEAEFAEASKNGFEVSR